MAEEKPATASVTVFSKLRPTSRLATAKEATEAAQMILSCYPDYGTTAPEYIVNLIDALKLFPASIMPKMVNLRDGVPARCFRIPCVADIVQTGKIFEEAEQTQQTAQKLVFIAMGTPEWDGHVKNGHKPTLKTERRNEDGSLSVGWYFPSELPPERATA